MPDRRTSDVVSYVIMNGWQDHQPARLQREELQTRIFFFLVKQVTIYIKWVCFETVLFCYSYSPCRPGWPWTGGQHSPALASQGLDYRYVLGTKFESWKNSPCSQPLSCLSRPHFFLSFLFYISAYRILLSSSWFGCCLGLFFKYSRYIANYSYQEPTYNLGKTSFLAT